jgi:phospholipase/carboxylesterase
MTRRELLCEVGRLAGALMLPVAGSCSGRGPERLVVAPAPQRGGPVPPGVHPLGRGGERNGVCYLPPDHGDPAPFVLLLHGAGGTGRRALRLLMPLAEQTGCVVVAPDSRGSTWDAIGGDFGPDVRYIERAVSGLLGRRRVDPSRIAAAGFSDGATYALGLGRANGDWFTHVIAYSPGFLVPARLTGAPRIYVSHGRQDEVLPIDVCSRVLVPQLRRDGYEVRYREFEGGHEVPPALAGESLEWFLGGPAGRATSSPQ